MAENDLRDPGNQRRKYIAISLLSCAITLVCGCGSHVGAQGLSFAPHPMKNRVVSVRELGIPEKARDEFERGLHKLAKRDPAASIRHFDAAIEKFPDYYEAYYDKGVAEMQMNKDDDALHFFQKAIDLSNGRFAQAAFGYGLALSRQGRAAEAEPIVRRGLETEPDLADGHVVLAYVLLKLKRNDEAEKSAKEALLLNDQNSPKGYLVLADVEAIRGNYGEQARNLDSYLKVRPDDPSKVLLTTARDLAKKLAARVNRQTQQRASADVTQGVR